MHTGIACGKCIGLAGTLAWAELGSRGAEWYFFSTLQSMICPHQGLPSLVQSSGGRAGGVAAGDHRLLMLSWSYPFPLQGHFVSPVSLHRCSSESTSFTHMGPKNRGVKDRKQRKTIV